MADIDYDPPKEIKSYEPKNPKGRNCQCIFGAEPTNSKIEQFVQNLFLHQVCTELQYLRKDVQAAENC